VYIEYHAKRDYGRFPLLSGPVLAPGASVDYKNACVRAGQREGQFKPVVLQYQRELKWDLTPSLER